MTNNMFCEVCADFCETSPCPGCSVPRYVHDCTQCVFLGQWADHARRDLKFFDLYWCNSGETVIVRYGSEGGNYKSVTVDTVIRNLAWDNHRDVRCLIEAALRVYRKGLLVPCTPQ